MRACSLLAIPPPPDRRALPGGLPDDLSQDNLSTWAGIVQDVAAGLIVPQPETEQDMETEGDGGDSPVTPNEDDLLMGASAAEVETGIASLHVDSPAEPRGDEDAAT